MKFVIAAFRPLRTKTFRSIWTASLASNAGLLIQGVGAAWAMAEMATADLVAMVQTAAFLPLALFAIPAGAIADMYDRRKVQIAALTVSLVGASAMTLVSWAGLMTPWALLGFCFFVGSGFALLGPAWQSSVGEQVPPEDLPQAVALNGISYNIARAIGPAVGGFIVAVAGVTVAFAVNALFYVPILLALLAWKRKLEPARLPPEGLWRAVMSGVRYIAHMQPVRSAVMRSFVMGLFGAPLLSLIPLISRDLLGGGASAFGLLLGCFGGGAVAGIFILQPLRRFRNETIVRGCTLVVAAGLATLALSSSMLLSSAALAVTGMAWMTVFAILGISLQLFVPRWVVGRSVATLQATTALGVAVGSACWGVLAAHQGVAVALAVAAACMALSPLLAVVLRVADRSVSAESVSELPAEAPVQMGISGRSGPIAIDLQYRIPAGRARDFYVLMGEVRRIRARNGAYDWSLSRDLDDPEVWLERYRCPTWDDYLRHRGRRTVEEFLVQRQAAELHIGIEPIRVRRWLERPPGSVRWHEEVPDRGDHSLGLPGS